jgi:ferredoxin--NADP+ reductase
MYKIIEKKLLSDTGNRVFMMKVKAPRVAKKAMPGQFIILRVMEGGERIPLTIADFDRQEEWITLIYQEVGLTTRLLSELEEGDCIPDLLGPLGQPAHLDEAKRVLCVGGGVGIAPLYPQVRYLHKQGAYVDVILGARTADLLILEEEMAANADHLYIVTDDGSKGEKGLVTDVIKKLLSGGETYDMAIAIGPLIMMKFVTLVTKEYHLPTMVSLNPIMVDGTGMCGGCRVTVGGQTKYACVDGPDFDGHQVDFDEAMRRQQMYKTEEQVAHQCRIGLERKA